MNQSARISAKFENKNCFSITFRMKIVKQIVKHANQSVRILLNQKMSLYGKSEKGKICIHVI